MPGFDGTGPTGQGPMTGRCRGYCLLKLPGPSENMATGFIGKSGIPFIHSVPRHSCRDFYDDVAFERRSSSPYREVIKNASAQSAWTLHQSMLGIGFRLERIKNRIIQPDKTDFKHE